MNFIECYLFSTVEQTFRGFVLEAISIVSVVLNFNLVIWSRKQLVSHLFIVEA